MLDFESIQIFLHVVEGLLDLLQSFDFSLFLLKLFLVLLSNHKNFFIFGLVQLSLLLAEQELLFD